MMNIFISRPTWLAVEYRDGLTKFMDFLKGHEIKPRTLGADGEYANKSPLDEIISILDECQGAIILGFPQIKIDKGILKDTPIKSSAKNEFYLPTEWNHIEASLAYAIGIPLLVIHHTNVRRGVFDRGAINNYIYEVDLTNPSWPLLENISGAFNKWKKSVISLDTRSRVKFSKNIYEQPGFFMANGVLLNRINKGIEEIAYCPSCKLAMSSWPPNSDEMLSCSSCNFLAPFRPSELKNIIKKLS